MEARGVVGFADYRSPGGRALSRIAIIYGPLMSRRRGLSLGINLFPGLSVCSFNCVYCFRGGAHIHVPWVYSAEARVTPSDVVDALATALRRIGNEAERLRSIDFSGNGEPTLHPRFAETVRAVREFIEDKGLSVSLGLFTNATRLCSPGVLEALAYLDHVEAKLDAAQEWKLQAINQPSKGISLDNILECLSMLRGRFHGEIALQVLLLGFDAINNYGCSDAEALARAATRIQPDVINLYTAYAPPRLSSVEKAPREIMERYATILRKYGLRVRVFPE